MTAKVADPSIVTYKVKLEEFKARDKRGDERFVNLAILEVLIDILEVLKSK